MAHIQQRCNRAQTYNVSALFSRTIFRNCNNIGQHVIQNTRVVFITCSTRRPSTVVTSRQRLDGVRDRQQQWQQQWLWQWLGARADSLMSSMVCLMRSLLGCGTSPYCSKYAARPSLFIVSTQRCNPVKQQQSLKLMVPTGQCTST